MINKDDELLDKMKAKEENNNRYLLHLEIVLGVISVISFLVIFITSVCLAEYIGRPIAALLMIIASAILITGIYHSLKIERSAGYYECQACHHKYVPTMKAITIAPHIGRTRYMKCPECGKRTWQKKVLSK